MKPLDIIKKYYPESSDAYRILVTHSRSVADKALALARLHPEMNLDLTFIEEATMLHDIGIFLCNAGYRLPWGGRLYLSWLSGSRFNAERGVSSPRLSLREAYGDGAFACHDRGTEPACSTSGYASRVIGRTIDLFR